MSPNRKRLSAIVFCIVSLAGIVGCSSSPIISQSSTATPPSVAAAVETPAIHELTTFSLADVGPTPTPAASPPALFPAPALNFPDDVIALSRRAPLAAPPSAPTAPRPFSIDLYRKGAFASQATTYYCVPAAIEVMINLIERTHDTSRATQDDLYRLARDYLISPYWGRGAQPEGWARVLNSEGDGHYELGIRSSRSAAIDLAARQLRATGKPVGLLVWAGYHAWVMSGFESIGDPAAGDFTVTGLFIEDVWWPRPDTSGGPSPRPDRLMSVATFARYFLPYDQHGEGGLDKDGKFVVIIPLAAGG
jgi:hypothetical protein